MPIAYLEIQPVVALDADGVGSVVRSGGAVWRFRFSRAYWRKFLECELRRLNEFEIAERADRGRVLPFERKSSTH